MKRFPDFKQKELCFSSFLVCLTHYHVLFEPFVCWIHCCFFVQLTFSYFLGFTLFASWNPLWTSLTKSCCHKWHFMALLTWFVLKIPNSFFVCECNSLSLFETLRNRNTFSVISHTLIWFKVLNRFQAENTAKTSSI